MYHKFLGITIIILTIILFFTYIFYNNLSENFTNSNKMKLGMETRHLEYAYKLCSKDQSSECRNFVILYDKLRKSFKILKKQFCNLNPTKCKELLKN